MSVASGPVRDGARGPSFISSSTRRRSAPCAVYHRRGWTCSGRDSLGHLNCLTDAGATPKDLAPPPPLSLVSAPRSAMSGFPISFSSVFRGRTYVDKRHFRNVAVIGAGPAGIYA